MQSGPAQTDKTSEPKEHYSLGSKIVDALKPHHKHKDKDAKKHHHHDKKAHDEKKKKHHHHRHHHHHQEEAIVPPLAVVNTPDVSLKPQTPPPALLPLPEPALAPKAKESAEGKVVKAITTTSLPNNPKRNDIPDCCKPPKQEAKKSTWSDWAKDTLPGVRLLAPLFALHRQAGQDWVNDVENVFSRVSTLEKKAEEAVNDYKTKLRPRSK